MTCSYSTVTVSSMHYLLNNILDSRIIILPQHIANKIAAGEVVNRPESAVKELLENSIDAEADRITLIIKDAGKSLMQVTDNGSGMSEEDARLCFHRHSTSKIRNAEDLDNITTLGFRGEALSSIAAVSQMEMKTRTKDESVGTQIRIEGTEVKEITKVACEKGTSVTVKNLFFNTPARRNFLKSNQTEFRHIYDTFVRIAISHPDIAFEFINQDDKLFTLESSAIQERIKNLFTEEFFDSLLPIQFENSLIKLTGYISKPGFTKKTKQEQFFYLNKRFFRNNSLNFAVYSGYDDLIEKGDYPSFIISIETDPSKVDVNIHPSKLEVRFEDEGMIFGLIKSSIKKSLSENRLIFDIGFDEQKGERKGAESGGEKFKFDLKGDYISKQTTSLKQDVIEKELSRETEDEANIFELPGLQETIFEHKKKPEEEKFNVWQFQKKYIICETEVGLMLIDQHAAHERILYENAQKWLQSKSGFSQQLIIPIKIELSKIDYMLIKELTEELQSLGFNFNLKENDEVEITGIPPEIKVGEEQTILKDLIEQYKEYGKELQIEKKDNLAKSFACRGAVKTGDLLQKEEMIKLIDNLFSCEMPYVCPHGRPTIVRINTEELDKRFQRL